jgi:hypothetical protein
VGLVVVGALVVLEGMGRQDKALTEAAGCMPTYEAVAAELAVELAMAMLHSMEALA